MSDPTGMFGWDDVKHAVNTGIEVATGGGADCVMRVTCADGATNASGICTIGVSCTDSPAWPWQVEPFSGAFVP